MSTSSRVSFSISHRRPAASRSWLTFFLAAMGMGMSHAAEQEVMKYWWVMPESEPDPAPQVFRVTGEKGENFEPVYNFEELVALQNDPAVVAARAARQEALRQEAMVLVRKLRQEGKSPMVAYEEAWTQVYSSHWLNANGYEGSSRLEELLTRLASEDDNFALTHEEEQIVLEALLEADHRLESSQGSELLRRLAVRLRALGYGKLYSSRTMSDQLMKRFADSMEQGMDSMSAYRDALFKTYRDRIMCFTMRGYMPPAGLRGQPRYYHQAPQKLTTTVATGALPGAPALKEFLATSPAGSDSTGEEEEDEEKKRLEDEQTLATQSSATSSAPAAGGGGGGGGAAPSMRGFSMRAAAPSLLAASDQTADLTVNGKAALYFESDGLTASGSTVIQRKSSWGGYTYEIINQGSYNNTADKTVWGTLKSTGNQQFWYDVTSNGLSKSSNWSGTTYDIKTWERLNNSTRTGTITGGVDAKLNLIDLQEGRQLYMGGSNYAGTVRVVTSTTANDSAYMGSYKPEATEYNFGKLSGEGTLTLVAHGKSNQASIYSFSDTESAAGWFSGTLKFGASQGGIVELDLGVAGDTTAWKNAEFDLTRVAAPGHTTNSGTKAAKVVVNLRNDAHIGGLSGGDANSTVTSQADEQDISPTLTLGVDKNVTYEYYGTFNRPYYVSATATGSDSAPLNLTKVGSNTQIITQDVVADVPNNAALDGSLNLLTVEDGTLIFRGELETSKLHALGGTLEVDKNLTVTGGESVNSSTVALQVEGPAVVKVAGTTTAYNVNVLKPADQTTGGQFTTGNLEVERTVHVDGAGSSLTVGSATTAGFLKAQNIYVTNAGTITVHGSVAASTGVTVGYNNAEKSHLTSTGAFETKELRLRSDAWLTTQSSALVKGDAYLHGGAKWEMSGTSNSMDGTLYLEGTSKTPLVLTGNGAAKEGDVVLTLPGTVDFVRSGWDGKTAMITLDGVTLDFYRGVTLTNLGFAIAEGDVLTLASGTGWVADYTPNVTVKSGADFYHGVLSDANGSVTITIQHKIDPSKEPFVVGASDIVYVEMHSDATHPALPYKAYDDAKYTGREWTDVNEAVGAIELMRFHNVKLTEGAHLYLGENAGASLADHHFGGNVEIVNNGANVAQLHGQIGTWGKWYLDGHLGGSGDLKLIAHHTKDSGSVYTPPDTETVTHTTTRYGCASIFEFSNVENPQTWLSGTLSLANPSGGIVQLNVGNVSIAGQGDTRWDNVVIDLTRGQYTDHANGSGASGTASELVLGVMGDATVAGLVGGTGSSVVSDHAPGSPKANYTLTLGDDSAKEYKFGGTVGSGRFYTGGQAYSLTTTTEVTIEDEYGKPVTSERVTTTEYNFLTARTAGISLTKVGSNTQSFSGAVYLDQLDVQGGKLIFSGNTTQIADVTVRDGATLQSAGVQTDSVTLYGGASWYTTVASNSYDTPVYLMDVFGPEGEVNAITIGSIGTNKNWVTTKYLNMAGAGTWTAGSGAIFTLDNVTLDLTKPRVITNMAGITAGAEIAMYSNWKSDISNLEGKNLVMVEDPDGVFYDAHYELKNGTLYLHLHDTARDYGIVARNEPLSGHPGIEGYIWSGENNGHTVDNDVHYLNMTMGNVWRADGSAHNTGWHEQRAEGSSNDHIGVYENGNTVTFADYNVHYYVDNKTDDVDTSRKVDISGAVAPGKILVTADINEGKNGGEEALMEYGYAFVSTDGTGTITDFGNIPTQIIKTGDAILIINITNSFTGGIDVQDGGLYLAAVGAAGTGTLTFHTDKTWSYKVTNNQKKLEYTMDRTGAELMICYPHSDDALSGFRGSTLTNDFVLTSSDDTQGGNFRISFAHASFNEKATNDTNDYNHANVPRHWRNVTLSGALVGTGDSRDVLELVGYCSTWTNSRDQSYVTSITMNEDTIGAAYKDGAQIKDYNRFNGTVVMKNTVNTSPLDSNKLDSRIAGTVQLVLKGEKLSEAHLDMTRESVQWEGEKGWNGDTTTTGSGWNQTTTQIKVEAPRQTYNNILVINGNTTLRGLSAEFQGCGWDFEEHWGSDNEGCDRIYVANMKQNDEVWHVRTLTNGLNTLQLGEYKDVDNTTYVYSGAMGFAQAYTGVSQAHVPYGDGFKEHPADGWYFGGHSMASESLNLTKASSSAQYIHTAKLQDISVYEGVLGFNSLEFTGNMNLVGGSNLKLGVVGAAATTTEGKSKNLQVVAGTGWNYIGSDATSGMSKGELYKVATTTDTATVNTGKTLTVITVAEQADGKPTTAVVDGNLTLAAGATLNFRTNGILPYSADIRKQYSNGSLGSVVTTSSIEGQLESKNPIVTLLTVNGKLTFADANDVSISLTGADFSTTGFYNKKYYLAAADEIVVGSTSNETLFLPRTISLGYGYFGTLYTVGDNGSSFVDKDGNKDTDHAKYRDYLVMTVSGDPRRTWSGMMVTPAAPGPV